MSNFQKSNKIDAQKNDFPSKSLVDSIKCTIFATTRTRQASLQCLNRRVVLFIAPLSLSSLKLSPSAPDLLFPSASDLWFRAFLHKYYKDDENKNNY